MGIISTFGTVVTLVLALPVAMLGTLFLAQGQTLSGIAMIVVAVLMFVVKTYVTTPDDLPMMAAERTVGTIAKDPDEDEQN
ncbi:DUF7533 family protein [Halococcus saccharolyticus]|uniref:Uncharacterized protein n=1 Tax=Halococcus saccharolyticus DSM 5350 TaxID=1227455 RepID=M0MM89_9EURY|nr:hypothetical protein [Halococcus saccharolyticus]EMA45854.1 hypothetical protein C449_06321 [Halococcus saccharolyticus DSM 5350]